MKTSLDMVTELDGNYNTKLLCTNGLTASTEISNLRLWSGEYETEN